MACANPPSLTAAPTGGRGSHRPHHVSGCPSECHECPLHLFAPSELPWSPEDTCACPGTPTCPLSMLTHPSQNVGPTSPDIHAWPVKSDQRLASVSCMGQILSISGFASQRTKLRKIHRHSYNERKQISTNFLLIKIQNIIITTEDPGWQQAGQAPRSHTGSRARAPLAPSTGALLLIRSGSTPPHIADTTANSAAGLPKGHQETTGIIGMQMPPGTLAARVSLFPGSRAEGSPISLSRQEATDLSGAESHRASVLPPGEVALGRAVSQQATSCKCRAGPWLPPPGPGRSPHSHLPWTHRA